MHNQAERARKRGDDDSRPGGSRESIQEPSFDLRTVENEGLMPRQNSSGVHESVGVGVGDVDQADSDQERRGSGRGAVDQERTGDSVDFGSWRDAEAWALVTEEVGAALIFIVLVDALKWITNCRSTNRR